MNMPTRQTCTAATVSLVFGILSWFALPLVGAIVAIISGHMAKAEIRRSQGALDGDGLAQAGLVLGYVHLAFFVLVLIAIFLFFGGVLAFLAVVSHAGHG